MNSISHLLSRLKLSLYLMFSLLVVVLAYLVILLLNSAENLNSVSAENSSAIFDSIIKKERDGLGGLTKDYAYWTDSVERLALSLDPVFVEDNFLGSYMTDSFGISRVAVAALDKTVVLSVVAGAIEPVPATAFASEAMVSLMQQALQADMTDPLPVTGFVNIDSAIHLFACVPITPHNANDPRFEFEQGYGLLLMSKQLDKELVDGWAEAFRFDSMRLLDAGEIVADHLGWSVTDPTGKPLATVVWQPDKPGARFVTENAPVIITFVLLSALCTGFFWINIRRYIVMSIRAASQLEQSQQQLNKLAYYDRITGLPNRTLATDRLSQALIAMQRNAGIIAVMFIDLDGFKPVNDKFGHAMGDDVLASVSHRLSSCVRKQDTVARVGGDEFLVILSGIDNEKDIDDIAEKILCGFTRSFDVGDQAIDLTASIGIAVAPRDGMEPDELIDKADDAMYRSKHNGKNSYVFFNSA